VGTAREFKRCGSGRGGRPQAQAAGSGARVHEICTAVRMPKTAVQAPVASPIQGCLEQLHARFAGLLEGQVASDIPELAKADPARFGIVIATVDGQVYEVGATRQRFTIQSISEPLVYGVALEDRGPERVLQSIASSRAAMRSTPSA
jgi:hypothetical protein